MFEEIIEYYANAGLLHPVYEYDLRQLLSFYEQHNESVKEKLREVIEKLNYNTLREMDDFAESDAHLEFWRGSGQFALSIAIGVDGDVYNDFQDDFGNIIGEYYDSIDKEQAPQAQKYRNSIAVDLEKYPLALNSFYEFAVYYPLFDRLYHTWFAYLWQEAEGYKCQIPCCIIENNSVKTFSLNDFAFDWLSNYFETKEAPYKAIPIFNRKLSIIELFNRTNFSSYSWDSFKNHWRYLEKDNDFLDICVYRNQTLIRKGKVNEMYDNSEIIEFKEHDKKEGYSDPRMEAIKYLLTFCNEKINEGWAEKLRPLHFPIKMYPEAIEFESETRFANKISEEVLAHRSYTEEFEQEYNIKLPLALKVFLQWNHRNISKRALSFPLTNTRLLSMTKMFSIDEIKQQDNFLKGEKYVVIAAIGNEGKVIVSVENNPEGDVFLLVSEKRILLNNSFENFLKTLIDNIDLTETEEQYYARTNNFLYFQEKINNGWDIDTPCGYKYAYPAVKIAAENNAYETLEFLLSHGANFEDQNYRQYTWLYDENTMSILDKYVINNN